MKALLVFSVLTFGRQGIRAFICSEQKRSPIITQLIIIFQRRTADVQALMLPLKKFINEDYLADTSDRGFL